MKLEMFKALHYINLEDTFVENMWTGRAEEQNTSPCDDWVTCSATSATAIYSQLTVLTLHEHLTNIKSMEGQV